MKTYNEKNKDILSKKRKLYYENKKDKIRSKQKEYYEANKNKIMPLQYQWCKDNREKSNAIKTKWKKRNPGKVRHYTALRRMRIKNQIPKNADLKEIKNFYQSCPTGMEVDHIIPVSKGGLHCISNLQYLTPEENRRKYNKIL